MSGHPLPDNWDIDLCSEPVLYPPVNIERSSEYVAPPQCNESLLLDSIMMMYYRCLIIR